VPSAVYYVLDGDEVIFRVPADGPLATHTGWSVLGVGLAHKITEVTDLPGHADRAAGWGAAGAAHAVAVPIASGTAAAQHDVASPAAE